MEVPLVRKWSPSSKLFGAVGVLLAVAAFLVVRGYAERARALGSAVGHPVPVAVASDDLGRGAALSPDMLRIVDMPSAYAPPGAVTDPETVEGRVLLAPLAGGEPLTRARLAPQGTGPIAALVPPGLRAFFVVTSLPSSAIAPEDRVDVMATFAGGQPHTEIAASGLEVLAVLTSGASPEAGAGDPGAVLVLAVLPSQAQTLAYARAFADLSVAIVGPS